MGFEAIALFLLRLLSVSLLGAIVLSVFLQAKTNDTKDGGKLLLGSFVLCAAFYAVCELVYWAFAWSRA